MRFGLLMSATLVITLLPPAAHAETVRFRYVPLDACGRTGLVAIGPDGAIGELYRGFGLRPRPYYQAPVPTHWVTFRHSNGNCVIVPLTLPQGEPRVETRSDRIVYHCDRYEVEVRFSPDGGVEVWYNSGWLRPLDF
ncbi:MAG: hypothetical protein NZO58_05850 [Gemmataceae bacterium]|nr:hypothetical protein [Gemmataceae bacterium]